jgi:hypothetical protein
MARAALEQALPPPGETKVLELHNIVWLKPLVVDEPKQVSTALFPNDSGQIDFEVYSVEAGQTIMHCQGEASFSSSSPVAKLDMQRLGTQTAEGILKTSNVYSKFTKMGLKYGPAHQGITAIHVGQKQVLAELRLPGVIESSQSEYALHPSLMDSALQSSIGLIADLNHIPTKPLVPFTLRSLRIFSACAKEMTAWVRWSEDRKPKDRTAELDIDVSDPQGNICVAMRGVALRLLDSGAESTRQETESDSSISREDNASFNSPFYQELIADVVSGEVSVEEAVALG